MLRPTHLYRMLRSNQTYRAHPDSSRIRAGRLSVLYGAQLWLVRPIPLLCGLRLANSLSTIHAVSTRELETR